MFVEETVIPTGERIHTLRGDRGTEFPREEVRQYRQDVSIRWSLPLRTPIIRSERTSVRAGHF